MAKKMTLLCVFALAFAWFAPDASACWDNSDELIAKLRKLDLDTEQLKDIFKYQKEHREVIARAHKDGLGCRFHENHTAVFEKNAIGVLSGDQFKAHTGRERTEVEALRYENSKLKKEIDRLKKQIEQLK